MVKRIKYLVLGFMAGFFLSSCSSIPLTTMIKLAGFDEQSLLAIEPDDVRALVELTGGLNLDIEETVLSITFDTINGTRAFSFPLAELEHQLEQTKSSWFTEPMPLNTYLLKISEQGQVDLLSLQSEITNTRNFTESKSSVTVSASMKTPEGIDIQSLRNNEHVFSVSLRLDRNEDFFVLIDNFEIDAQWEQEKE